MQLQILLSCWLSLLSIVFAIPTIHIKGTKFYTSDGAQWFIKGVAYQLVPQDPLIDGDQCKRDIAVMKTLGVNAIRVYHVDSTANHQPCMDAFAAAGIYLFVDLDTFDTQIMEQKPTWNSQQLQAFSKVMDAFHSYDNVAGFFIGNEALSLPSATSAAVYVKAATRDMKAYREAKGYRRIPIGYSSADVASSRPMLQNYLACGNASTAIEFFALNAYEWCGQSTFATSGYATLTDQIKKYNIPAFFSETGCNNIRPRLFGDMSAIYSNDMTPYWSGSIVYEWIQEENNFGIISYGSKVDVSSPNSASDGWPRSGTPTPVQPDFNNLSKQWASASPSSTPETRYTPSNQPPTCPASTSGSWDVDPKAALPTAPSGASTPQSDSYYISFVANATTSRVSYGSTTRGSSGPTQTSGAANGPASISRVLLWTAGSLSMLLPFALA